MSNDKFSYIINPQNIALIPLPIMQDSGLERSQQQVFPINPHDHPKHKKSNEKIEEPKENAEEFEWINYLSEKKEINYVMDFINKKSASSINYKALDLQELEDVAIINVPKEFQTVAQDQYKRLLRFGGLDSKENIGLKSGALDKENYNDRYNDYYDLNDPWINDDEEENLKDSNKDKKENKKMAIPEVYYKDFFATKGNLADFVKSTGYIDRMKLLDNFDNILEKNEKEAPVEKKRKFVEKETKNTQEQDKQVKKKLKKKVKPNSDIEFLNPYNLSNPFLFTEPANNFVVAAPGMMGNINHPGMIPEQLFDKLKSGQMPNFIDMNNIGNNIGVDLFNILFSNNGKIPTGFSLPPNIDFSLEPMGLPSNMNMNMTLDHTKSFNNNIINNSNNNEKNMKKKEKNLDFKAKREINKNSFSNADSNFIIEINDEDSPERENH